MLSLRNYNPLTSAQSSFLPAGIQNWSCSGIHHLATSSAVPQLVCTIFVDSKSVKCSEALLFGFYLHLALNMSPPQPHAEKSSGFCAGLLHGARKRSSPAAHRHTAAAHTFLAIPTIAYA